MTTAHPSRRARATAAALAAATGLGLAAVPVGLASASASTSSTTLTTIDGTKPNWLARAKVTASPSTAQRSVESAQQVRVYLAPKGGLDALKSAVSAVSDPTSASYRSYLTAAQYRAHYEPTQAAEKKVTRYLKSKGLTVAGAGPHRRYVTASGSRTELDKAFGVTLRNYTHDGQQVVAPSTAAKVPAALGSSILTVTGLDTTVDAAHTDHLTDAQEASGKKAKTVSPSTLLSQATTRSAKASKIDPPEGTVTAKPCSTYWNQLPAKFQADYKTKLPKYKSQLLNYASCGYTGMQLYTGIGGEFSTAGAGQTIAIVDAYASDTMKKDLNTYSTTYGIPKLTSGQYSQVLPTSGFANETACGASDWTTEQTLDVEAVHAMRPSAKIRYYAAADCVTGLLDTLGTVVDDDKADVVSNSWGAYEIYTGLDDVLAYEQVFLQGAMQGQTFVFSSGDNGDEVADLGVKTVEYPASDPYITSVGGTSIGLGYGIGLNKAETGWGNNVAVLSSNQKKWEDRGFLYGAGGGFSNLFAQPDYQQGTVPSSLGTGRAVPDVANVADPATGMLVGQTQTFGSTVRYGEFRVGGTSLAAPLIAGKLAQVTEATGKRLGFANPLLYKIDREAYYDIEPSTTKGTVITYYANQTDPTDGFDYYVRTWDQDSSLKTLDGWDPVTGLGRPNGLLVQAVQIYTHTLPNPTASKTTTK
ncbi:S53 family peptidase [Luteimicrobium xylanilyticum]|uniref:Sedolisin n=1 Tax=Luteimicrobium xylanilyticum TaxID=1133546 RepID=A0A5P9QGR6_9MICO|nr:S53 family peptidase [Luteimicrobium xylanilyticum]QFU99645.1 Sedolisin [Luteimicrobium xylanilyticum]